MVEAAPSSPNPLPSQSGNAPSLQPQPSPSSGGGGGLLWIPRRPPIRVTTEYDSGSSVFFHKISCKFLEGLAKVRLYFQNDSKGEVSEPQLAFTSKHFSLHYDLEEQNALVKGSFDIAQGLQLKAFHDVKAQQGEVAMVADLAPSYKLELASAVPSVGLPKATLRFPLGEVSLEEKEDEEEDARRMLSINGILKAQVLDGVINAQYNGEDLSLRYSFKDEQMTFIPKISLPSNAVSFAFKRRFGSSDKLSYSYNFDSNYWSAVYKHVTGKDYKFKAGYDSEVKLGWISFWVGEEDGKAKIAPMKMKVQFMLQVPQEDLKSSALMFRVKKRWDI